VVVAVSVVVGLTGPVTELIIERVKCVYDEMQISAHSLKAVRNILKNQQLKEILRWNTAVIGCTAQVWVQ
jgi:hypothetical protein